MDLAHVESLRPARTRSDLALEPGETVLAGGSWLFSTPQPAVSGLVDLTTLGWPPVEQLPDGGLRIAATCTIAELVAADPHPLVRPCAEAFLMSFKVWNVATVGGNLCLALPAGAMIALTAALAGEVVVWTPDGGERREPVATFVRDVGVTTLAPGEVVRAVELPASALAERTAWRRIALTRNGRTAALVIGRAGALTVTGATRRPVVLGLHDSLDAVDCWYTDPHGPADWREAMSRRFADEIRGELS